MIHKVFLFLLLMLFGGVSFSNAANNYKEQLPNLLRLIEKGDAKEKKLALRNVWFLKYGKFRKNPGVWDPILKALKDKDPTIREAAAASLKTIGEGAHDSAYGKEYIYKCCSQTDIVPSLIALLDDEIPDVRAEASKALGMYVMERREERKFIPERRAVEPLIKRLKDTDPWVRLNALWALGEIKDVKAVLPIIQVLKDDADWRNKYVQQEALIAFGKLELEQLDWDLKSSVIETLQKKVHDPFLRLRIIKVLGKLRAYEAVNIFLEAQNDPDENIRSLAIKILSKNGLWRLKKRFPNRAFSWETNRLIAKKKGRDLFVAQLKDPSPKVRKEAIKALARLRDPQVIKELMPALEDDDKEVRVNTVEAIVNSATNDKQAISILIGLTISKDESVRIASRKLLKKIVKRTASKTHRIKSFKSSFQRYYTNEAISTELLNLFNSVCCKNKLYVLEALRDLIDIRILEHVQRDLDYPDPEVRKLIIDVLRSQENPEIVPLLIVKLKDEDDTIRKEAAIALGRFKDKRALKPLIDTLKDADKGVREYALRSLGWYDEPVVFDICMKLLEDKDTDIRRVAISNLGDMKNKKAVEPLIAHLQDPGYMMPWNTAIALGKIGDTRAVLPLMDAVSGKFNQNKISSQDENLVAFAAEALGKLKDKRAIPVLMERLLDKNKYTSVGKMAMALEKIGDKSIIAELEGAIKNKNLPVYHAGIIKNLIEKLKEK